jgi:hypothetical protein
MKKFFLFVREAANPSSGRSSDTGVDLSTFAVPVDNLSYITAAEGSINITFTDTSLYEEQSLFEGEAVEKTNVTVSCNIGEEVALIENILSFIGAASGGNVMRFDVTKGESTFNKAVVDSPEDISAVVRSKPVSIISGELSTGDAATEYQGTIGEIFFGLDNLPELDFNHEGLADYAIGANVTSWRNFGTLGSTHTASSSDPIVVQDSSSSAGFRTRSINLFAGGRSLDVPNGFSAEGAYTLYAVFNPALTKGKITALLYGDDAGETVGLCFNPVLLPSDGGVSKSGPAEDKITLRHSGRTGAVASANTTRPFPVATEAGISANEESCEVVVIRRDEKSNIFLHHTDGEIIAQIPAKTQKDTDYNLSEDNMTDGALLIERIGTANSSPVVTDAPYKGSLARFGVIKKDIGSAAASQLAQDLFNLYNF